MKENNLLLKMLQSNSKAHNKLSADKTFNDVFAVGAKPFLLIEIYKILILTVLSKQLIKIRKFI